LRLPHATKLLTANVIGCVTDPSEISLNMLSVFAEFKQNLRRKRQIRKVTKAQAARRQKGRPFSINAAESSVRKADGAAVKER
jgi:DNA invertase Pin-like site-specific DNA recombinase